MQGLRVFWGIMKHYAGKNFLKSCFHRLTAKVGLEKPVIESEREIICHHSCFARDVIRININNVGHVKDEPG